jgi:signal transduction histidine kinase
VRLCEFITAHRDEIMDRWSQQAAATITSQSVPRPQLTHHIPSLLDELARLLRVGSHQRRALSADLTELARVHATGRKVAGFDIAGVVREYGLVHDAVLTVAMRHGRSIRDWEHLVLARWVFEAMTHSVARYARLRDEELRAQAARHFSLLAHELRNPLQTAMLVSSLLGEELSCDSELLDRIDRAHALLLARIDASLVDARPEPPPAPRRQRVDLAALVREAAAELAVEAEHKEIDLRVEGPATLPIEADPEMLASVLEILLHNAVKFTVHGGAIVVRARAAPRRALVEVEDECGGIGAEEVAALFAPAGGVGLPIARQAVEAHDGSIRFTNLPGKGCVFVVDLPE